MNTAKPEESIDCLVIGAGVAGLATALALLDDGREVTVIDQGLIGKGASHGNCGTLTPSHAPVSYTHLDVYKRQLQNQRRLCPGWPGKGSKKR